MERTHEEPGDDQLDFLWIMPQYAISPKCRFREPSLSRMCESTISCQVGTFFTKWEQPALLLTPLRRSPVPTQSSAIRGMEW